MRGAQAISSVICHAEGPAAGQRVYDLAEAKTQWSQAGSEPGALNTPEPCKPQESATAAAFTPAGPGQLYGLTTATAPSGSPPLPVVCSPIQTLPLVQCKGPSPHPGGPAQSISAASVGSPDCPPNHKLRNTVPSPPPGDQNEGSGQQPQAYLLHAQLAWPHVQWGWRLRASQRHIVLAG